MKGILVNVAGNLTRDPEISTVGGGTSLAKFTIAVQRSWKNESTSEWEKATSYLDVVCWRYVAEDVARLLQKGMRVTVSGRLDQQTWEDRETGKNRSRFEVTADEIGISLRALEGIERRRYEDNGGGQQKRPVAAAARDPFGDAIWS
jgi:single-strand DNA-binding protein